MEYIFLILLCIFFSVFIIGDYIEFCKDIVKIEEGDDEDEDLGSKSN